MDDAELAQRQSEQFCALAIKTQRGNQPPAGESATECLWCGKQIPEARRVAVVGCTLCIDCMRKAEQSR